MHIVIPTAQFNYRIIAPMQDNSSYAHNDIYLWTSYNYRIIAPMHIVIPIWHSITIG